MPIHSARPFPVRAGTVLGVAVDAGFVPVYVAEIAYARAKKRWEELERLDGVRGPDFSDIERGGGLDPEHLLDLLAGGESGTFTRVWRKALPDIEGSDVLQTEMNARAFPIRGGPVSDGTGIEAGHVPAYMAQIAFILFQARAMSAGRGGRVPFLEQVERAGGYLPHEFLDLLCGGDGSGASFAAMQSRGVLEARRLVRGLVGG